MKQNLEKKYITVFTDGGWCVTGLVELDQDDRIGLLSDDGDAILILKSKISIIKMSAVVRKKEVHIDPKESGRYNLPKDRELDGLKIENNIYSPTEENSIGINNQYGSILPSDLLEGESDNDSANEFAISWGPPNKGKIEVLFDPTKKD